jgi:hypothetical protein
MFIFITATGQPIATSSFLATSSPRQSVQRFSTGSLLLKDEFGLILKLVPIH